MKTEQRDPLTKAVCRVLKDSAFMFGEPVESDDEPLQVPVESVLGSIRFTGHFEGTLLVAVSKMMCAEIAANMMGLDSDDPEALNNAEDAFKEMLNVMCGNMLALLAGTEPVFDLDAPQVTNLDAEGWTNLRDASDVVSLIVDEYPVLIELQEGGC